MIKKKAFNLLKKETYLKKKNLINLCLKIEQKKVELFL